MANKTIIIADDQVDPRELLEDACKRNYPDYNIEVYNNGNDVEKRFRERGFDGVSVAILDEVMDPGLRGSELSDILSHTKVWSFLCPA